jgi:hypothetical protein
MAMLQRRRRLTYNTLKRQFQLDDAALGCAYACAGHVAEALPLLEEAEQSGAALGTMGGQSLWVGYVSEAYLLAGRMQEAVQLAERALTLARAHKERGYEAWAMRLLGEIAAHQAPQKSSRPHITTGRYRPWKHDDVGCDRRSGPSMGLVTAPLTHGFAIMADAWPMPYG